MSVREGGEMVIKVSRTKVINEIISNTDWKLDEDNVNEVMEVVLDNMDK
jgi:hypothetical protein